MNIVKIHSSKLLNYFHPTPGKVMESSYSGNVQLSLLFYYEVNKLIDKAQNTLYVMDERSVFIKYFFNKQE